MTPTTSDMERTAVMPSAAPMGAGVAVVAAGLVCTPPIHATGIASFPSTMAFLGGYVPMNASKPWTIGNDRQVNQGTTARPTRHLGSVST